MEKNPDVLCLLDKQKKHKTVGTPTHLHLPHEIVLRLHMHEVGVIVITQETAD